MEWMLGWIKRINEIIKGRIVERMNVRMNNKKGWDKECKNEW